MGSRSFVGLILGIAGAMAYREYQALRTYDYSFDRNGDRWPDDITHYERGIPIWRHMDENFDGRTDYWEYYNADGEKTERSERDNNFDGKVDGWGKWRDGQVVEIQSDTDFNGQPDVTEFYSNCLLTSIEWRPNGTNIVTARHNYLHGNPTEELRDLDYDGYFDVSVKFDRFFQPISTNHLRRSTIP